MIRWASAMSMSASVVLICLPLSRKMVLVHFPPVA
jgi:hypothetical protein